MNEISDNALMVALGRQMTQAVQKQAVSAGNIANLDTPGYRAREVSFGDVLDGEVNRLQVERTNPAHLGGSTRRTPRFARPRDSTHGATATTFRSITNSSP
jgi:flagellar basal-body rod protein FlgB